MESEPVFLRLPNQAFHLVCGNLVFYVFTQEARLVFKVRGFSVISLPFLSFASRGYEGFLLLLGLFRRFNGRDQIFESFPRALDLKARSARLRNQRLYLPVGIWPCHKTFLAFLKNRRAPGDFSRYSIIHAGQMVAGCTAAIMYSFVFT